MIARDYEWKAMGGVGNTATWRLVGGSASEKSETAGLNAQYVAETRWAQRRWPQWRSSWTAVEEDFMRASQMERFAAGGWGRHKSDRV